MHFFVALGSLDQGTDGRGCGVENRALVALNHLPEASGIRVRRHAFKDDLCRTGSQWTVGHIGMAGDPADVCRAPEHVGGFQIECPVHRELGPQQVAASRVLHTLGFAGRTRRIQNEQRVLGSHGNRCTLDALAGQRLGKGLVAACHHVARRLRALVHIYILDGLAATHGQAFVHDGFEWQLLTAAHLEIGRDNGHGASINDAFLQCLGREAAEHHTVRSANTGTGLHGNHAFQRHGHVDQHAVALLHAVGLEGIGKLAHTGQQFFVGGLGDGAVIGFKNHGHLVFSGCTDVLVQAVGRSIEFTVIKPFVERRVGLVQRAGERLVPEHVFAGQAGPKAFEVFFGLFAKGVVTVHTGNTGCFHSGFAGRKHAVFNQD